MTGHRSFNELRKTMSPVRRARNADATRAMIHDMALHELRQARQKSQEELAAQLHVGQPAVAKMERRTDMYVSNLRRYIEALGGTLEITARFPDTEVTINNFSDIADESELLLEKS
ncbi:MAG: putative transcriptional regulator [Hyphomicrobiales bacterium]|nr:putative transcriptional regulator [Hyphomicrobiales bacterium]